jgi:predicted ATP-grasp superfamily ATP-dependent carboligase
VLITEDAPAYGVLAAVRGLRAGGFLPWVAVSDRDSYAARSRACEGTVPVPSAAGDRAGYVAALADAAATLRPVAVLPGTETALLALAGREAVFGTDIRLGTCAPDVTRRATDKAAVAALAADAGIESPPSQMMTHAELDALAPDLDYPLVVKTARSTTEARNRIVRNGSAQRAAGPADVRRLVAGGRVGQKWLVQPCVQGRLTAVSGVAWRGAVVCTVHQQADRIFPRDCGISALAATVPPDRALEAAIAALMRKLRWSGLFQLQFLDSGERRLLIDLNPRVYGSLALALAAGSNLVSTWAELLAGRRPSVHPYRVGVRYCSEERYAGALAAEWMAGRRRAALAGLRPKRGTTHAVFSLRDPMPMLTMAGRVRAARRLISEARADASVPGRAEPQPPSWDPTGARSV